MKRLPPAKRNQLIVVIVATITIISVIYFMLISPQQEKNKALGKRIHDQQEKLQTIRNSIKDADGIATTLGDVSLELARAEQDVASGDVNSWTYDTIRRFKASYHVDIPSITQPSIGEVDLLQGFPYKQAKVNLTGTAYFHDLGKFIADFENNFPHMRMVNLSIEPTSQNAGSEKLLFRLDIVTLIKPNT